MAAALKGRGALSNPADRFARTRAEGIDDGWFVEPPPDSIETTVQPDHARSIINTNDSPDIPFEQSINPYRGCSHGCVYCVAGDTPVLLADGTTRPIAQVRAGDAIYGTRREGRYRRYVHTQVLAQWSVLKQPYRIVLQDGTQLVAGGDHRFLTERGWKYVTGAGSGRSCRPHLTTGNRLIGTGAFAHTAKKDDEYRGGYLCGLIRGAGMLGCWPYERVGRTHGDPWQLRLAMCDAEALHRARLWLAELGIATPSLHFRAATAQRRAMSAIGTHARAQVRSIQRLIGWPRSATPEWHAGFLAGIFDAEGSYSDGVLRISNTSLEIIDWMRRSLRVLGFGFVVEQEHRSPHKPIDGVRIVGGLREQLRFFHTVDPAITRKRDIQGQAVKNQAKLGVACIEPLGGVMRLYDITTGTGDFIANGVVSHNCYARPSHAYMGLSSGLDFETKLFFKQDAAQLLTAELARPGYVCKPITLGANTDPYQPLEKQLRVTRDVLEVLERTSHPVSIVTKSTLILRDLELLAGMARRGLVQTHVSITSLDRELKRRMEPRAASPQARLEVVRQLSSAGIPVSVLVAPVIPVLTDHELERILEAAVAAGAGSAGYVMLRLPYEVKDLFREWLATHYPLRANHVMSVLQSLRGGRDNDPRFGSRMRGEGPFADLIRVRFRGACARLGLSRASIAPLRTELFRRPLDTPQLDLGL